MVLSGFSGGIASILGKIALSPETPIMTASAQFICIELFGVETICSGTKIILQIVLIFVMLYFNVIMLSNFLRALETRGSLPVTVVCSAVNFLITGILSSILLGEKVNLMWCLGACLIMCGIFFIMLSQGGHKQHQ